MNYLFFDTETRSEAPLKDCGAWRYSEHQTTDCLCAAWAINDEPVEVMKPADAAKAFFSEPISKDMLVVVRNAPFDFAIMVNVLIPKYGFHPSWGDPSKWLCTAALSRMHGLPASLEGSAEYLNKVNKKLPDGKRLIGLYSIPATDRKTGKKYFREIPPDDWKKMLDYNKKDVAADREAFKTLIKLPNFAIEEAAYRHDFALNIRGVRIDTAGLNRLVEIIEAATERAMTDQRKYSVTWKDKDGKEYTDALNVRSVPKLKAWLLSKGFDVPDTRIDTLEEIYEDTADEEVREVLSFRFFLAKASLKKYRAAVNRVSPDGRLRYFLKYFGAHTGRYAGEGFQIHNLPKSKWPKGVSPVAEIERLIREVSADTDYKDLVEYGKKILPGLMIPDEGKTFIAGDFSAIEARGIAWLAGCDRMLSSFKAGTDLYIEMAERINKAKPNRQLGKAAILGCGYGMGISKFEQTCKKWGIDISSKLAEDAVEAYRSLFSEIPAFWYTLEDAFRSCWLSKQPRTVGEYLRVERGGNYLRVRLPSGRWLYYHQIKIEDGQLSYLNFGKKGARVKIWGGTIAENVTQAMCRDILTDRMLACEAAGLPVQVHIHDEIVIESELEKTEKNQKLFDKIMNTAPSWAIGFPLKTETEITSRYHK